uniref:CCR4-NOT transcription complex subunit 10 n=1 Tax=Pinguiococcus pyrenoidosus TaxID=172671 RepID=A0A7R9YFP9_9STRA
MEEAEERREELAERAFSSYVQGDYSSSISCLEELLSGRESDPVEGEALSDILKLRIEHNLRVVRLLQPADASRRGRDEALSSMQSLLQSYKPSLAAKILPVLDGTGPTSIYDGRGEDVPFDCNASRLLYNYALLLFSMKQYRSAQYILEGIWTNIGLCSEATGIAVVCLLLDVLIHTARGAVCSSRARAAFGSKVAPLLQFLSKAVSDEGSSVANGTGSPNPSPDPDDGSLRSAGIQAELAFRTHLYKAKCSLLQQSHRTSRKELKSALELYQRVLREGHGKDLVKDTTGSRKTSELLAALLPLPRPEHANATALFLKANYEYLRNNYKKVLKLLDAASRGANEEQHAQPSAATAGGEQHSILTPSMRILFLNNMGCLHLRLHRARVALHYFQQALSELENAKGSRKTTSSGQEQMDLEVLPSENILYNTGLQLLLVGRPQEAFAALRASATLFTHRPRLWIRLAECCIGIDAAKGVEEKQRLQATSNKAIIAYGDLVRGIAGKGRCRRVLLPIPENQQDVVAPEASDVSGGGDGAGLGSSLKDAVFYLSNAIYLSQDLDRGSGEEMMGGSVENGEARAVYVAAHTHLAYVYLRLGCPTLALDSAEKVIAVRLPDGSEDAAVNDEDNEEAQKSDAQRGVVARRHLAHTYAAEALCLLGKPDQARAHLRGREDADPSETSAATEALVKAAAQASASAGLGVKGPWGLLSPEALRGGAPQAASGDGAVGLPTAADANATAPSLAQPEKRVQSDTQVNLATVALMRGNLQQAHDHMELALQQDTYSPRARRTLVFWLLRYGHTEKALRVLKGAVP